ncbi:MULTISPECIES: hypothetical protein [Brevundimonas]|uniref:hypothetical protein n=1 Tax=Brevundimonas TaxID=41275 RepID=UPI0025BC601E|nr:MULTISPECIES: hypothetical protein [Brevundimonas]
MNLSDAFDQYVTPALAEYHAAEVALSADEPDAELLVRRRSRAAAVELHQFADRVFHSKPAWLPALREVKEVRDWLASTLTGVAVADVGLVGDVAELSPRMLAQKLLLFSRADANAQTTRSEISKTRTRLHELENLLVTLEAEIVEAADYAEAYFLRRGDMG